MLLLQSFCARCKFVKVIEWITMQVLCIHYEYVKEDKRSLRQAFKVTVQKLLLVSVVCATAIRGAYFFTKVKIMFVLSFFL